MSSSICIVWWIRWFELWYDMKRLTKSKHLKLYSIHFYGHTNIWNWKWSELDEKTVHWFSLLVWRLGRKLSNVRFCFPRGQRRPFVIDVVIDVVCLCERADRRTHAPTHFRRAAAARFCLNFFFWLFGFLRPRNEFFFSYFLIVVDCGSYRLPRCWPTTAPQSTCRGLDVSVVPNETKTKRKKKQQQQKKQTNHKKKWSATP